MKVKDLPRGAVLWSGDDIIGVVGLNVDVVKYGERDAIKVSGNPYDWELLPERK